ncbi:MAG: cell wall hydrolase [Kiloniellaceae bacterium]
MTENVARKRGWIRGPKPLRTAIWAGAACCAAFLGNPAAGGQLATGTATVGNFFPQLERADPGKKNIFDRPTPADPRDEVACLALNIYFEARGEPDAGKLAVGHVVMNRVSSPRFPGTVCEVVRQGGDLRRNRCQFSWWCDGRSDKPKNKQEWQRSSEFALGVYWGQSQDPTEGALWYHADYVKPAWRKKFERGPKIGRHIFYRQGRRETRLVSRLMGK